MSYRSSVRIQMSRTSAAYSSELRLPGPDAQSAEVEIPRWAEVSGRYGLEVVGPPIPE